LSQLKSLEAWEKNFYRWKNDPIYHPISIEVESDQIHIGFILLRSVKSLKENESKDSAQSHQNHEGQEGQEGQEGWVDYIVLDESYRGLGYGARALKMAVEYASKELSLSKLSLWVSTENLAALKCFEKSGFKATALEWDREQRCEKFRMDMDVNS
jgi:RimJ/RimL family protein N-acetyltransferase